MINILNFFLINYTLIFTIRIFKKSINSKNSTRFKTGYKVHIVESYKNLDLWYTQTDYNNFRYNYLCDLNKNHL